MWRCVWPTSLRSFRSAPDSCPDTPPIATAVRALPSSATRRTPKTDADAHLDYVRALRIRLLGDRLLQRVAWKTADKLAWSETFDAEYVALTQLQADAFVTLDRQLAQAVAEFVVVAPIEELY